MVALLTCIVCGFINYNVAEAHNKDKMIWGEIGLLTGVFGLIALLIAIALDNKKVN